jgi:hypothetical protein
MQPAALRGGGLIVGPGGQNIKSIKEESGADVQVGRCRSNQVDP